MAFIGGPVQRPVPDSYPRSVAPVQPDAWGKRVLGSPEDPPALAFGQDRGHRERAGGVAARLRPVLDEPTALAGERGEPGLRVDRDREADRLEHRQVARRAGVGDAL